MYVNLGEILDVLASKIAAKIAIPQTYVDLRSLDEQLKLHAYRAARSGELQAHKKGKRWYCAATELDRWMQEGKTSDEGDTEDLDELSKSWVKH